MGFDLFITLIKGFIQALSYLSVVFIPFILVAIFLIFLCILNIIYFRYGKHMHPKLRFFPKKFTYKGVNYVIDVPRKYKSSFPGFFKNLFYLFPRQYAYDFLHQDPNAFGEFGVHMVTGEQGSGKTMTVVYLLQKWKDQYPRLKIFTNMAYKYEDGELIGWRDLLEHNNGIYGVVNVIDEIKTWWSNRDSKDVPPEILGEICQQRKQKKATIGTVQVFSELAKPFRSQTHFVYKPKTFFGCLTIVLKSKAKYYDAENDRFRKYCGFFVFAHTKRLREAYDTYKKIEKYKDTEFATSSAFTNGVESSTTVVVDSSTLKKR